MPKLVAVAKRRWASSKAGTVKAGDDEIGDALDGLDDELVNEDAYAEAVAAGIDAGPGKPKASDIVDKWIGHARKYAAKVPGRIGESVDAAIDELTPKSGQTVADVLDRFNEKLEALRVSVTRYAEPVHGAGQNGYGASLKDSKILMVWVLDSDDPCEDCVDLAEGSPYEDLPTWPGYGDTICLSNCKCSVEADPDSWDASLASGDDPDE